MKKYICITNEGFTESPKNEEVECQQVLGYSSGNNEREAIENLLKECPYIIEYGFDEYEIIVKELR
ncbi:MAG: hypothetical protein LBR66_06930 [Candidatus Symbiothrix sp.]|jgi:hypothetical protein|nr:hypothetical protein [Candidatus Symbiothrix sp.]